MICRGVLVILAVAYALALLAYLSGTFGWFGQTKDPLSGIFLIPLGMPWSLIDFPQRMAPVLAALAPALNLGIIWVICRKLNPK